MENASKALIMAAGILIGMLILSLGIYLAYILSGYAAETQKIIEQNSISQFNDKFMKYDDVTTLNIQDVITVKNYALENNNKIAGYDPSSDRANSNNDWIDVFLGEKEHDAKLITSIILKKTDEELLQKDIEGLADAIKNGKDSIKYTCNVEINKTSAKVNKIYFWKTP